ncbi:hypothetical protein BpHYR1_017088 [Brachionus plicatilis]|uniref:Uncharacterized protein n=1 Tax=Brachionus plicatilis TaxID=10195 RepID=A0A3M7SAR2_BRAPC|nr:hypothetical protein BpHYR1_017088 [Brachionus plicatilis]
MEAIKINQLIEKMIKKKRTAKPKDKTLKFKKKSPSPDFLKFVRSCFISKKLYTHGLSNAIDLPNIRIFLQFMFKIL